MSAPVRVICVGSPFGDDAVGLRAAALLQDGLDPAQAELSCHDRPGARLVEALNGARKVVLVDGVRSGAAAGALHCLRGEAIFRQLSRHTSTHGFGLADALALAARLGVAPDELVLYGIEIESAAPGAEMSAAVEGALPGLVEAVRREVAAGIGRREGP
jgi:hydrogenase maturation protease